MADGPNAGRDETQRAEPPRPPEQAAPTPTAPSTAPSNGLAVAALVLGIIAVVASLVPILGAFFAFPVGIVAIVLGVLGRGRAREIGVGQGQAMAGLVLGGVAIFIAIAWFLLAVIGLTVYETELREFLPPEEAFLPEQ